jgi:hypothetical protein
MARQSHLRHAVIADVANNPVTQNATIIRIVPPQSTSAPETVGHFKKLEHSPISMLALCCR